MSQFHPNPSSFYWPRLEHANKRWPWQDCRFTPKAPRYGFFVCHPQHPMFPRGLGRKSRQEHKPERFFLPRSEYLARSTPASLMSSTLMPCHWPPWSSLSGKVFWTYSCEPNKGFGLFLVFKIHGFRAKHVQTYLWLCRMNPLQILAVSGITHHPIDLDSWKAKARARPVGQMALVSSSLMMPSADASGEGYI